VAKAAERHSATAGLGSRVGGWVGVEILFRAAAFSRTPILSNPRGNGGPQLPSGFCPACPTPLATFTNQLVAGRQTPWPMASKTRLSNHCYRGAWSGAGCRLYRRASPTTCAAIASLDTRGWALLASQAQFLDKREQSGFPRLEGATRGRARRSPSPKFRWGRRKRPSPALDGRRPLRLRCG